MLLMFPPTISVIIIDDSDANWWKGSNHRGEGLFPGNMKMLKLSNLKASCLVWKNINLVHYTDIFNVAANFVTTDLDEEPAQFKEEKQKQQRRRSVTFNEEVEVRNVVITYLR